MGNYILIYFFIFIYIINIILKFFTITNNRFKVEKYIYIAEVMN